MDGHNLALSLEQRWSDEVRYLHSLWHRGPPGSNPNPNPNPNPTVPSKLAPANPISFKKNKKKKKHLPNVSDSDKDPAWNPSPPLQSQPQTGWPQPPTLSLPKSPSAEDKEKSAALQLQRNYFKLCHDFLEDNDDSDDDNDNSENEGSQEFDFFSRIFKEDDELRNYYRSKYEGGEFCCLVCGGFGQKLGKKFKDCVGLVQHSTAISKTKRRTAHRAFGLAICRLLGWEITRLPSIVLSNKVVDLQEGDQVDAADEGSLAIASPSTEDVDQLYQHL